MKKVRRGNGSSFMLLQRDKKVKNTGRAKLVIYTTTLHFLVFYGRLFLRAFTTLLF